MKPVPQASWSGWPCAEYERIISLDKSRSQKKEIENLDATDSKIRFTQRQGYKQDRVIQIDGLGVSFSRAIVAAFNRSNAS